MATQLVASRVVLSFIGLVSYNNKILHIVYNACDKVYNWLYIYISIYKVIYILLYIIDYICKYIMMYIINIICKYKKLKLYVICNMRNYVRHATDQSVRQTFSTTLRSFVAVLVCMCSFLFEKDLGSASSLSDDKPSQRHVLLEKPEFRNADLRTATNEWLREYGVCACASTTLQKSLVLIAAMHWSVLHFIQIVIFSIMTWNSLTDEC
jgi:hypothetical protein